MSPDSLLLPVIALGVLVGFSFTFWISIGLLRRLVTTISKMASGRVFGTSPHASEASPGHATSPPARENDGFTIDDIAVIVPARNEERALPRCIEQLSRLIPSDQVYVASDGSTDQTVRIAESLGCNVVDIQPNGGKAKAIQYAIDYFNLCRHYRAVLILDADTELESTYFQNALPLFADSTVAAVAVHQKSIWRADWFPSLRILSSLTCSPDSAQETASKMCKLLYTAYRIRLFRLMQGVYQYGQSWAPMNVSYIAPGAGSIYRTSALSRIDITAPGLVIEDFNMTFEVHHKRLGRVAYTPLIQCFSEDPFTFGDYYRQIRRWYLGFWQTVRRHGLWSSKFCLFLFLFYLETLAFSLFLLLLPFLVIMDAAVGIPAYSISAYPLGIVEVSPLDLLAAYLIVDLLCTFFVAMYDRRPEILLFAPMFPLLRIVDAAVYLVGFVLSFGSASTGAWASPTRQSPRISGASR